MKCCRICKSVNQHQIIYGSRFSHAKFDANTVCKHFQIICRMSEMYSPAVVELPSEFSLSIFFWYSVFVCFSRTKFYQCTVHTELNTLMCVTIETFGTRSLQFKYDLAHAASYNMIRVHAQNHTSLIFFFGFFLFVRLLFEMESLLYLYFRSIHKINISQQTKTSKSPSNNRTVLFFIWRVADTFWIPYIKHFWHPVSFEWIRFFLCFSSSVSFCFRQ